LVSSSDFSLKCYGFIFRLLVDTEQLSEEPTVDDVESDEEEETPEEKGSNPI